MAARIVNRGGVTWRICIDSKTHDWGKRPVFSKEIGGAGIRDPQITRLTSCGSLALREFALGAFFLLHSVKDEILKLAEQRRISGGKELVVFERESFTPGAADDSTGFLE
jgi:hypothetical protein